MEVRYCWTNHSNFDLDHRQPANHEAGNDLKYLLQSISIEKSAKVHVKNPEVPTKLSEKIYVPHVSIGQSKIAKWRKWYPDCKESSRRLARLLPQSNKSAKITMQVCPSSSWCFLSFTTLKGLSLKFIMIKQPLWRDEWTAQQEIKHYNVCYSRTTLLTHCSPLFSVSWSDPMLCTCMYYR